MRRAARSAGFTVLEIAISTALLSGILLGAQALLSTSTRLADSETRSGVAAERVSRALRMLTDALRHGSLATTRHVDGTNFADGTADAGIQIKSVLTYRGAPVLSAVPTNYHYDAVRGDLVRSANGVDEVLASGVTSFSVSRSGNLFVIDVAARCGPADDRARTSRTRTEVAARNP